MHVPEVRSCSASKPARGGRPIGGSVSSEQQRNLATELAENRQEFLQHLSHEMRTPLNVYAAAASVGAVGHPERLHRSDARRAVECKLVVILKC